MLLAARALPPFYLRRFFASHSLAPQNPRWHVDDLPIHQPGMSSSQDDAAAVPAEPTAIHPAAMQESGSGERPVSMSSSDDVHHSSGESTAGSDVDARISSSQAGRPMMGGRQQSATMIVPRETKQIERQHEVYEEGDARTMSPRRSSDEIEQMSMEARQSMIEQARHLQASLLEVVEKVETVRSEQEKLEGGNRFLQSYIGELMQTSKITSTGPPKKKGKARGAK